MESSQCTPGNGGPVGAEWRKSIATGRSGCGSAKPFCADESMVVVVDRSRCIGCGLCQVMCPGLFKLDGECVAYVEAAAVPPDQREQCRQAAGACPIEAIICKHA